MRLQLFAWFPCLPKAISLLTGVRRDFNICTFHRCHYSCQGIYPKLTHKARTPYLHPFPHLYSMMAQPIVMAIQT